jgi:hypothetical protein
MFELAIAILSRRAGFIVDLEKKKADEAKHPEGVPPRRLTH